jgi:predicted permease
VLILSSLSRDLIHAVRSLARARAFTFVCVASLGVGMGTVIAILMMVRAIVGTPPLVNTDGLVELLIRPHGQLRAQTGGDIDNWTYADFIDVSAADTGMALTAWTFGDTLLRTNDSEDALRVPAMYVSPNYFTTIGVALARGPGLGATSGDASSTTPIVVVDHDLWTNRLGARDDIVGTTITLNRVPHVVVGVTPQRFRGHLSAEDSPDVQLWVPLPQHPRLRTADDVRFNRQLDWLHVIGRLSAGTSLVGASASASAVMAGLAEQHPVTNQYKAAVVVEPYHPLGARSRPDALAAQAILFGISGMVLFIVCLNVSGMMLVRAATRERELSVRLAIGASRARLVQYILSEALVIALLGGALAVFIIFGIPAILLWYFDFWHRDLDLFRPDVWTYLMCLGLCFVTTLVFGLLPALRFSRPNIVSALKDEAGGGARRVGRVHRWTAAIQAGIAVPFLVIGGVKLDQVRTAAAADVGFTPSGLFAARVDLSGGGQNDVGRNAPFLLQQVTQNLAQATGVSSVAVADGMPLDFRQRTTRVFREGDGTPVRAHTTRVNERFFETLGIRLSSGRGITREDTAGSALVVVLSEPLAAKLFPGEEAVGKRLTFSMQSLGGESSGPNRQTLKSQTSTAPVFTVVGVTRDVVTSQMGTERPQIFVPLAQHPTASVILIARASAADALMTGAFKNAVTGVDPEFVASSISTGDRLVRRSVVDLATHSAMAVVCAGVALTLAALGVYGVVGFMVATRTREFGVRMALGASRPRVLRTVLTDAIKVVVPGVGIGLVLSVVLVRVSNMPETWYALGGAEPMAYALAAAIAMFVALVAGLPSARRAVRINPIQAMRSE